MQYCRTTFSFLGGCTPGPFKIADWKHVNCWVLLLLHRFCIAPIATTPRHGRMQRTSNQRTLCLHRCKKQSSKEKTSRHCWPPPRRRVRSISTLESGATGALVMVSLSLQHLKQFGGAWNPGSFQESAERSWRCVKKRSLKLF